jgi:REP element-mobilizing transposase RayT
MARQVRIQFEGAVYHVMARGDRRESIIGGDKDRKMFIETFGEACQKTGWLVDAWVLMSNHYHLVLRTPQDNLVAGMRAGYKILTLAVSMFEISFGVTSSAVATRQSWSRAGNSAPAII